jgi:hypothetical protein
MKPLLLLLLVATATVMSAPSDLRQQDDQPLEEMMPPVQDQSSSSSSSSSSEMESDKQKRQIIYYSSAIVPRYYTRYLFKRSAADDQQEELGIEEGGSREEGGRGLEGEQASPIGGVDCPGCAEECTGCSEEERLQKRQVVVLPRYYYTRYLFKRSAADPQDSSLEMQQGSSQQEGGQGLQGSLIGSEECPGCSEEERQKRQVIYYSIPSYYTRYLFKRSANEEEDGEVRLTVNKEEDKDTKLTLRKEGTGKVLVAPAAILPDQSQEGKGLAIAAPAIPGESQQAEREKRQFLPSYPFYYFWI